MAHPSAEKEMKSFEINLKSGNPQYYEIPDIHVPPTLSDDECFIRIIHVSDVYLLDNFARLKTLIDQSKNIVPKCISTLGGDFLSPGPLTPFDPGKGTVHCMNSVGFDYASLGNHEQDVSAVALRYAINKFHGVIINSNMRTYKPKKTKKMPQQVTLELTSKNGLEKKKIALLGVLTEAGGYHANSFEGAASGIVPPNECVKKLTAKLKKEGINAVIPMTHQGADVDQALAGDCDESLIPVLLGSHDHATLFSWNPSMKVPLIKPGIDAELAFIVDLTFAKDGSWKSGFKFVKTADYSPDPEVQKVADKASLVLKTYENAVLHNLVEGPISSVGVRNSEQSVPRWFCSALRNHLHTDLAILHGGCVRGNSTYKDHFTFANLKSEIQFPDAIVRAKIEGRIIAEAVEQSRAPSRENPPRDNPFFLHLDDGCKVKDGKLEIVNKEPIDLSKKYMVAVPIYILQSGSDRKATPLSNWYAQAAPEEVPHIDTGIPSIQIILHHCISEIYRALGGFAAMDKDGDKVVTRKEIEERYSQIIGLDVNHDNLISEEERAGARFLLDQFLETFDANHDGVISIEEVEEEEKALH
jgi:2',3'-cyclic-nucleotide 2'-phosphodiesterase (5'-nucleotidase family)